MIRALVELRKSVFCTYKVEILLIVAATSVGHIDQLAQLAQCALYPVGLHRMSLREALSVVEPVWQLHGELSQAKFSSHLLTVLELIGGLPLGVFCLYEVLKTETTRDAQRMWNAVTAKYSRLYSNAFKPFPGVERAVALALLSRRVVEEEERVQWLVEATFAVRHPLTPAKGAACTCLFYGNCRLVVLTRSPWYV